VHDPVPQTPGFPPPPQVSGGVQLPQSSLSPHPFGTIPQETPRDAHVATSQATPQLHMNAGLVTAPQHPAGGSSQLPHSMMLPHPSSIMPHVAVWSAHVEGTHGAHPPAPPDPPLPPAAPPPVVVLLLLTLLAPPPDVEPCALVEPLLVTPLL
jgi:hypothetical protein